MKLGIVVQCPSPHQKVLLDSLFRVPGVDVVCAYAFPANPSRTWGVPRADGPTTDVPFRPGPGCYRRIRDWVAEAACDVWVLGSVVTALRTQLLASALNSAGVPWAFLGEPPRPRSGWRRLVRDSLLQRVLSRCDGAIGTGREPARRYRELLGDDRPVASVPYFIPLAGWLSLPLIDSPPLTEPVRFLAVAQLIPRKGLDILVEACSLLPREGWTLDVYGEGPERQRLQSSIDARSLPITLHRPVPFDRRMEAYRGKHCFVFPSRWDGWGMAPVEALAAGLPVIASDQTMSAYDFLVEGESGWIVPCGAAAFAAAMARLLEDRSSLPGLSRSARRAVADYSPDRGAAALVAFCQSLIQRHRIERRSA
jgi:glycosyltransferase involved in cell wall biosynthesis